MSINKDKYLSLRKELGSKVVLVAVSKTKSLEVILELYDQGQRDFGENYVQELLEKARVLPNDIKWHFIGHLQSNKVKQIIPFVQLIQSVDSLKLLEEINKQAGKVQRKPELLLQIHIAEEETKFGLDEGELEEIISRRSQFGNVIIRGLMGMATFTDNLETIQREFKYLRSVFEKYFTSSDGLLSMGMSSDYDLAVKEGSTMVRIGSLIFGERN